MAFLGQFDTLNDLQTAYPNNTATVEDFAFVGTSVNKIEYRWSEDGGGAWYDAEKVKGAQASTFGYESNPSFTDEIGYLRKSDGSSRRLTLKKAWKGIMTQKGDLTTLDEDNQTPIRIAAGVNDTVLRYVDGVPTPSNLDDLYLTNPLQATNNISFRLDETSTSTFGRILVGNGITYFQGGKGIGLDNKVHLTGYLGGNLTELKARIGGSNVDIYYNGNLPIATQTEYLDKSTTKIVTPENIANDVRQASFSIVNKSYNGSQQTDAGDSATWLPIAAPQLIPTGGERLDGTGVFVPGLNLLSTMLSANETNTDLVDYTGFEFKDTANTLLNGNGKWFNDTDKKWLAPSPLYTFNEGANRKMFYRIRIPELIIQNSAGFNGNAMKLYVRLLRFDFNAQNSRIVRMLPIDISEIINVFDITVDMPDLSTNVKGETDPFVSNGFYIDIIKSPISSTTQDMYLRHVRIDIERN